MSTGAIGVEVEAVTDARGLAGMRGGWNALLAESPGDSIFLTWEWLDAWWRAYGERRDLRVLAVRRGGRLVGIAPTYRTTVRRIGVLRARTAVLLGDGSWDSDYLDLFAVAGEERAVLDALLLDGRGGPGRFDVLRLHEVPETSPFLPLVRSLVAREGWLAEESEVDCPYVPLPETWEAYLSTLKPRMRTKVRSLERNLEASHEVGFDRCGDPADLEARLESLFDLHGRRWSLEGREGVFGGAPKRAFYADMARRFLDNGWLRFWSLSVDRRWAAHQFCFERNGTVYLLQEGYDPTWHEQGVGNVLRARVLRECIERGARAYDFLGGATAHKMSWGASLKRSYRLSLAPPTLRGRLWFRLPALLRGGKARLKALARGGSLGRGALRRGER